MLYEFGGIYADLDMEFLHPLDAKILNQPCFIATEPLIHSIMMYDEKNLDRPLRTNALIGCRPKHPFFKYVIDNLRQNVKNSDQREHTGPFMLDALAKKYTRDFKNNTGVNSLFLAPPEYFLPTYDQRNTRKYEVLCKPVVLDQGDFMTNKRKFNKRERLKFEMCLKGLEIGFEEMHPVRPTSYTNCHWQHTHIYKNYNGKYNDENIHIHHMIPHVKIVYFNETKVAVSPAKRKGRKRPRAKPKPKPAGSSAKQASDAKPVPEVCFYF